MANEIHIDHAELDASIRRTVMVLRDIDPVLQREAVKSLKKAADAAVQTARADIPDVPTSTSKSGRSNWGAWGGSSNRDWNASKVRSGIGVGFRGSRKNSETQRPLLSLVQKSAAGAVFDMAGSSNKYTNGPRGEAFVRALGRHGDPSRGMWPAVEKHRDEINAGMEVALGEMEATINARLGGVGAQIAGL